MSTRDPLLSREIGRQARPQRATSCAQRSSSIPAAGTTTAAARPTSRPARRSTAACPGYAPTRVVDAPALAAELGLAPLSVKDESHRLGLPSFKILGASWAVYRLLVGRLGHEPEWRRPRRAARRARRRSGRSRSSPRPTATTGAPSRTWPGSSATRARILVPAGTAAARIDGDRERGRAGHRGRRHLRRRGRARRPRSPPTTCSSCRTRRGRATPRCPRTVIEGYATIFAEVDEQLAAAPPDVVVVPMGVGALAAAVVQHYAARATIVAVEPLSAACGLALRRGRPSRRGARPARLDHGRPQLRHGVDRSRGRRCRRASTCSSRSTTPRPSRRCAISPPSASSPARRARPRSPGCAPRSRPACPTSPAARALVLCTEGATDPVAYRRIVGREP